MGIVYLHDTRNRALCFLLTIVVLVFCVPCHFEATGMAMAGAGTQRRLVMQRAPSVATAERICFVGCAPWCAQDLAIAKAEPDTGGGGGGGGGNQHAIGARRAGPADCICLALVLGIWR